MNHILRALPGFAGVATLLRAGVLVPMVLLLHAASSNKAPHPPGESTPGNQASRAAEHPPINPEVVQEEVERQESFKQLRRAACPRRIPDRHEERRPFPAIDILQGLEYVTISDDTSRGAYEKVIEVTGAGRQGLGSDLEEESDRYVITIARREYVPGLESFDNAPGRDDRLVVSFRWQWKPLNPLGERLNLSAPNSDRPEHQGRATYARTTDGWKFDKLWLDRDARDYVRGLYK